MNHTATYMPPSRKRGGKRKRGSGGGRRSGPSTVRLSKGKVVIRVAGFSGTQKIAPAILIRKIAKKHIRRAANSVLKGTKKGSGVSGRKKTGRKVRRSKRRRTKKN